MDITIKMDDYYLNIRAAAIIIHNNKLLVHNDANYDNYALVGGRMQIGEDSKTTIKREILEEMGKEIEILDYACTVENFFDAEGQKFHELMFTYLAEFKDEKDKKIEETIKNIEGKDNLQYDWIDLKEIDNYNLVPHVIKDVIKEKVFPVHIINDDIK